MQRVLESPRDLIGGEESRGMTCTKGNYRRYPPWVHFFRLWKKGPGASRRLVQESRLIKGNRAESPHSCLACQHEIQRVGGSQGQAVWQMVALRRASENHVLGGVFFYHGQAEEVATGI